MNLLISQELKKTCTPEWEAMLLTNLATGEIYKGLWQEADSNLNKALSLCKSDNLSRIIKNNRIFMELLQGNFTPDQDMDGVFDYTNDFYLILKDKKDTEIRQPANTLLERIIFNFLECLRKEKNKKDYQENLNFVTENSAHTILPSSLKKLLGLGSGESANS